MCYNVIRIESGLILMYKTYIEQSWTSKEILHNARALKSYLDEMTALFSCKEPKKYFEFKKRLKHDIYSLQIEKWKCDRLWEYLHGDVDFDTLWKII